MCPKTGLTLTHRRTGQQIGAYCNSLRCHSCIVPKAIRAAEAIALAAPTQWITLTRTGRTWAAALAAMQRFRRWLLRRGIPGDYCYHIEPFDHLADSHAHLWFRGAELDETTIRTAAVSAGMGEHVAVGGAMIPVEHYERPAIEYGLKLVLWQRPDEPTELWESARTYLRLNGGRLTHTTGNFWLDGNGEPCDRETAEKAAHGTCYDYRFIGT